MSYLNTHQFDLGAESQQDAAVSVATLQRRAEQLRQQIVIATEPKQAANLSMALAETELAMEQNKAAWRIARPLFDLHLNAADWTNAVLVCDLLFRTDTDDSLIALGNGLWLSVTFPIDPELTVLQLRHVIEDTPADSDGAAVAAAVAAYVVELRGQQNKNDDATLAVGQMLNEVARRHGNANTADEFNQWFSRLELDQPAKFLVRMRNVIDVLVQGQWWFDRQKLQQQLPEDS